MPTLTSPSEPLLLNQVKTGADPPLAGKMAAPGYAPPRPRQGENPTDSWTKQQIADFLNQHEDLLRKADPDLSFPIDSDGYLKADLLVLVHAVLKELNDSTPNAPA